MMTNSSGSTGTPPRFNCKVTLRRLLWGLTVTSSCAGVSVIGELAQ